MILTTDMMTNLVLQYYDGNRDGRINLNKGSQYEAERLARKVQPGYDADTVSISWVSHARLFEAADRNQDHLASREEIHAVIRFFDKNLNGQLENAEMAAFQKAYAESHGLIRSDRVPRSNTIPDQGYSFYGVPRALGQGSAGIKLPSSN
ncbi:MAG TPA: hypothetical protein V6D23_12195 [Candidatus Obscuribacterales bacterium]